MAHNYKRMNGLSTDAVAWLTIGVDAEGQRIDNFLIRTLKGVPKSHIYRILRSGEVRINKRRARPDTRLAPGDTVRIPPVRAAAPKSIAKPTAGRKFKPNILFEDDALIAIDKPAGLAVHGGSGIALGLIEQLRQARPDARFLELVHRLFDHARLVAHAERACHAAQTFKAPVPTTLKTILNGGPLRLDAT